MNYEISRIQRHNIDFHHNYFHYAAIDRLMPNYSPILEPDYLSYHLKLKEALNEADDRYYAHQVLFTVNLLYF